MSRYQEYALCTSTALLDGGLEDLGYRACHSQPYAYVRVRVRLIRLSSVTACRATSAELLAGEDISNDWIGSEEQRRTGILSILQIKSTSNTSLGHIHHNGRNSYHSQNEWCEDANDTAATLRRLLIDRILGSAFAAIVKAQDRRGQGSQRVPPAFGLPRCRYLINCYVENTTNNQ